MNLTSPEFLINMKSIPDETSSEYRAFWADIDKKATEGCTINGVYFSPFLYWHLNLWSIYQDVKENGRDLRKLGRPQFWDSMMEIDEAINRADQPMSETNPTGRKGVLIVGSRRISKSVFASSYNAHKAIIYRGSEVLVSGLNQPDIKVITDYMDLGIRNLPDYFRHPRIEDDWKKQVTFGFKDKKTNIRNEWAKVHIRNFDEGNNTEAAAGLTLSSFFLDEVGKGNMLNCLAATIPCFDSPYGWRCVPILTGTGGEMRKGQDAQKLFNEPEAYNFLPVTIKPDGTKVSLFIPGTKSLKVPKDPIPLSKHLNIAEGSELDDITIWVADPEKGEKLILESRELRKKASGTEAYLKEIMYYPLNPDECFLDLSESVFPVDLLQAQLINVQTSIQSINVELYEDTDGVVRHKFTDKKPVSTFPIGERDDKTGVIQIWEMPVANAPFGLYTAGIDPYKQSQAKYSTSLGSIYIFKRVHNLSGEGWRNMVVAAYNARPKNIEDWYKNVKLLLSFYNTRGLCENMDYGLIQHCIEKNEAHKYLERTPKFLTDVHPNTTVQRDYGIHMTTEIKGYLIAVINEYLNETISVERDERGEIIKEKKGVTRILDPLLLKELIKFNPAKGNFDRVISFGLTLAMAKDLNGKVIIASDKQDKRFEELQNISRRKNNLFVSTRTPFKS